MMEEKIVYNKPYDIRRYMITKDIGDLNSEPKMREREERSFWHLFLLLRRFDSRVRSVAI